MKNSILYKILFFKYLVIFFELYSALIMFQHFINNVFRKYLDIFILVYIDDLLIYSNNVREYKKYIYKILKIFRKNSL